MLPMECTWRAEGGCSWQTVHSWVPAQPPLTAPADMCFVSMHGCHNAALATGIVSTAQPPTTCAASACVTVIPTKHGVVLVSEVDGTRGCPSGSVGWFWWFFPGFDSYLSALSPRSTVFHGRRLVWFSPSDSSLPGFPSVLPFQKIPYIYKSRTQKPGGSGQMNFYCSE